MTKMILLVSTLLAGLLQTACSDGSPTKHKRDPAFFNRFVNPSENFNQAEHKLSELKVLTSNDKYKMRYALFDNGKFYYEVDNLGHGTGKWSYREGALNLFANRTMFDLDINLLATAEQGDEIAMQFLDRFGNNTVKVQLREGSAKPLQRFSMPNSGSL